MITKVWADFSKCELRGMDRNGTVYRFRSCFTNMDQLEIMAHRANKAIGQGMKLTKGWSKL